MINQGMFTSTTDQWATPQDFYDKLNEEFGFTVDVCALPENTKCSAYFSPELDGLKQEWLGVCWCNPPYGRGISDWIKKASEAEATVVCLVPARTDTAWWHDYAMKADDIRFIRGRLKFGGSKNSAPFPSAVLVYRK